MTIFKLVQTHPFYKITVAEMDFNVFAKFLPGVEGVRKAKIRNDDISIAVKQQVLQLEISMNDALFVKVAYSRH